MKIKGTLILVAIIFFVACDDFLQVDLQKNLTQDQFPVTPNDALAATNAVYSVLRLWEYNRGQYPIDDIMSDDARKGSNPTDQASEIGPFDDFSFTTSASTLNYWWNALYLGVKRANVVIEKVSQIEMDTLLRNRYIAEAKFLRAIYFMDLVRAWGDVPLVITLTEPPTLSRENATNIYFQIESDLLYAINNLPLKSEYTSTNMGRATKGAAQAFLAKAYLYQNNYSEAAVYALEVIKSKEYSLEPVFTDACGVNGNWGVESVFEVGSVAVEVSDQGGNQYANTQGVRGVGVGEGPNRGWGFNRPSMDLRRSFESGDPRLKGTIIDLGDIIDGDTIYGDSNTPDVTLDSELSDTIEIECYNRKVWVPGSDTQSEWACHRRLMRYAEVLLIAAEALNEDDKPDEALIYLNEVRERAREGNSSILPDITVTDKSVLREKILLERRHELALEGHRFWDLVRVENVDQTLVPLGFVKGKNELLPIPQTQMDISNRYFIQNPGW